MAMIFDHKVTGFRCFGSHETKNRTATLAPIWALGHAFQVSCR